MELWDLLHGFIYFGFQSWNLLVWKRVCVCCWFPKSMSLQIVRVRLSNFWSSIAKDFTRFGLIVISSFTGSNSIHLSFSILLIHMRDNIYRENETPVDENVRAVLYKCLWISKITFEHMNTFHLIIYLDIFVTFCHPCFLLSIFLH